MQIIAHDSTYECKVGILPYFILNPNQSRYQKIYLKGKWKHDVIINSNDPI